MISESEIKLAKECLSMALKAGAQKARVNLVMDRMNLVSTLDSRIDKCTSCFDRSVRISIFADGRFGAFSTNKLEKDSLEAFIAKAVDTVKMLAPDPCRDLPPQERVQKNAVTGRELDLLDETYCSIDGKHRKETALAACLGKVPGKVRLVSEEGEYSDNIYDTLIVDSQGTFCRQTETSFEYFCEVTVEDENGEKYSSFDWAESPRLATLLWKEISRNAYDKACAMIGARNCRGRRCNMVVDREVSSKFVTPILRALRGDNVQQHNSFLDGKEGQKVFPEGMTIADCGARKGESNCILFDDEGVAAKEHVIIDKGIIREYFLNTYSAGKLGKEPTCDGPVRPKLLGWPRAGLTRDDILEMCGDGILVTEFNGGNTNTATGDFSFGIEGFVFKKGKIAYPVKEMLVTGNIVDLWSNLIACGDDSRACMSKLIPTLAFCNVDFNG
ncbi:MAG: TldD/PmbA family protein [Bacteroidales bacterium]|nr:TldD/PmbA family protein [Candidatus Cryptobacteroides fimicaballi]